MLYYVIEDKDGVVAVVFHDYVNSYYAARTKVKSFQVAFDAAILSINNLHFIKKGGTLKPSRVLPDQPLWIQKVLKKACGNYWSIVKTEELSPKYCIDDVVKSYLS